MAAITAKDVAALRAKTGIGMMECKKALVEAEGDMEKALKVLRERGLAVAAKKEGRIAADGIVEILKDGDVSAMIEVNSETDFVAKNASFREFVEALLKTIVAENPADIDALLAAKYIGSDITVNDKLKEMIFQFGEKINIRRFVVVHGITSTYVHGGGVAGVIVGFDTTPEVAATEKFAKMAKNVALQIASGNPPTYIKREDVPENVLAEEKAIQIAAMKNDPKNANKPENILEKIVVGKLGKYYEQVCLNEQEFFLDDGVTVGKYIADTAKELGAPITVREFHLYEKGEGIEKREDNFADEIAKLTHKN